MKPFSPIVSHHPQPAPEKPCDWYEKSLPQGTLEVRPCLTPRDFRLFETCAEKILRHARCFVPPLPGTVSKWLGPKSPFRRHGEIFPFLARRAGKVVGRVAAILNRSHNSWCQDTTGFFGFFECCDDPAAARALLDAVGGLLRSRGFSILRGPYNPSIHDECGLLTQGFEDRPCIGLTWNPPYYDKLLRAAGLRPAMVSYGYYLALNQLDPPARLRRLAEHVARRSRVCLRPLRLEALQDELPIIQEVYNATLERNWGFYPITAEDLQMAASDLRQIADPGIIKIAEQDGRRAGVALALPDLNTFLATARPLPRPLRPLFLLALLRTKRPERGRQVMYGVAPAFRDRGLHAWLSYEHFLDSKARYSRAVLGWIQENNTEVLEMAEFIGGERKLEWTIYEKPLEVLA